MKLRGCLRCRGRRKQFVCVFRNQRSSYGVTLLDCSDYALRCLELYEKVVVVMGLRGV